MISSHEEHRLFTKRLLLPLVYLFILNKNVVMKKSHVRITAMVILFFSIVSSCSKKDSSSSPTSCNFGTNFATTTTSVAVQYSASNQNGGTLSSITYLGRNGAVIVSSPTLPWTIIDTLPQGKQVNISAIGTAPAGGSIYLTYTIDYTNGVVTNTTGCGN